jgi:DNA polymerase
MTSTDEARELVEALRQLRAHVEYVEELGVSHVEEVPLPVTEPQISQIVTEGMNLCDSVTPVVELEGEVMPSKKPLGKPVGQQSLFGELTPPEPEPEPAQDHSLDEVRADVGDCIRCRLCQARTTIVFGEGDPTARIMFVGEGPGADEDAQGRPFVGRAGQLLTKMIEAIGLRREDVYITNVVMCRPPGNRTPEPDEIAACEPFLLRRIKVIKPDVIVTLGAVATQTLLTSKAPISQLRGRFFDSMGTKILPTFHPAYLLRSPDKKKEAWEDLKKVRDFLGGTSDPVRDFK